MIVERIDPPGLAPVPAHTHATVAKGDQVIHISGQTGVDADGVVVGPTLRAQATQAFRNLVAVIDAVGAGPGDVARMTYYVVDYRPEAVEDLMHAALEVFDDAPEVTASTLLGVSSLWQPDLLFEVDAVVVL